MERSGSSGNSSGSGSRNTGNGTGKNSGNESGSGRAAPPGGAGRALLCLALLLLLPPARALPSAARTLPSAARTLPSAARTPPGAARTPPTLPRHSHPLAQCLNRSWDLLEATNASLHRLKERGVLRFNCTFEEVDVKDITEDQMNTIRACTAEDPGPGNCPVLERSTFDEGKCLQGISEDLRAYRPHLRSLEDPQLLVALDALMEAESGSMGSSVGSSVGSPVGSSVGSPVGLGRTPFPARLRLCGALLAFRIRSVTISRMLNFLSSL
ncbi:interleukin-12 subunit alpha [Chamaea fasciata]|uniref:interleukin-12 subunit alpha n=1 Tax=Chamaea fasciata TaxID=190680 RepID=UPI00336AD3B0